MWCGKYISFFIVFSVGFSLVNLAYGMSIGQVKMHGDDYVRMTENPNADSPEIGWIPEGEFVQIYSGPFAGTLHRIPVKWHQIEYEQKRGFVLSHLLNFYELSSKKEKKDIATVKVNGNGYVNIKASSNVDASAIGCIPEGKIVKVQGDPIQGYLGDLGGHWYKVEYQGNTGFIWGGLLKFYTLSPQDQGNVFVAGEDEKAAEKKLAEMVIDMIKNGQDITFTYKDGKLSLDRRSGTRWNGQYSD